MRRFWARNTYKKPLKHAHFGGYGTLYWIQWELNNEKKSSHDWTTEGSTIKGFSLIYEDWYNFIGYREVSPRETFPTRTETKAAVICHDGHQKVTKSHRTLTSANVEPVMVCLYSVRPASIQYTLVSCLLTDRFRACTVRAQYLKAGEGRKTRCRWPLPLRRTGTPSSCSCPFLHRFATVFGSFRPFFIPSHCWNKDDL